ncbi:2Fe-2S iron-sulfur cluster-binding protein [Microbacterium trichothecenolyticum]|uniref:Rhodocoxin n=1 Tax=Microbacterium trichothecenolyticum TaxID=69370 RepID=A0A0M2H739_MICTR|nr:2Fe-2S iron-sulfur cluster-binding protein [Microbacterium trichothecenolyticum]KJL42344.1 Rhodocoxin [Microbacterium trichothecenolyticum]
MPKVTFRIADTDSRTIDAPDGTSVMLVAVQAGIPGIVGECGGDMSCATCHVYVEDQTGFKKRSADEEDLLELSDDLRETSRLSCQLKLSAATPEVEVEVPPHD